MAMTVRQFQAEMARQQQGRKRGGRRYSVELREFAVGHALGVQEAGGSVCAAARELGVSDVTLSKWLRKASKGGKLREVRVASQEVQRQVPSSESLRVTTAGGHVVSGLSVQQVAELLRALS